MTTTYIDQGVNLKELKKLQARYDFETVHNQYYENKLPGVEHIPGAFVLDRSLLDTAFTEGCDFFVTNNPRDFIKDGARGRLAEINSHTQIVTLAEFKVALENSIASTKNGGA